MRRYVECAYCGGKGTTIIGTVCPACKGYGKVRLRRADRCRKNVKIFKCGYCGGTGATEFDQVCPVCGGAGKLLGGYPRVTCSRCGGTGKGPLGIGICSVCHGAGSIPERWIKRKT